MDTRRQCPTCGATFQPRTLGGRGKGRPQIYCSDGCRTLAASRAWRDRNRPVRKPDCAECGRTITHNTSVGRPRRFCSETCKMRVSNRRQNRSRLPLRDTSPELRRCAHCGDEFTPKRRDRIYCYSGWCGQAAYSKRKRTGEPKLVVERTVACHGCGTEFTAKHPTARWCSKTCANRHWGNVRARQRGALSAARYTDREIFERDGWACYICGQPVERGDRRADLGATIDHIVPISNGGTDEPGNVATAHWKCNRDKGSRH